MLDIIKSRIETITECIEWIKQNKTEHYGQLYIELVKERCKLRRLEMAERDNPAIATYGESQKGKSYVISNLLQRGGDAYMVKSPNGSYDFINSINPISNSTEATGVVTRFSSYSRFESKYREAYPVMVRLLTVTDIVSILCDGFFNDVKDPICCMGKSHDEISSYIEEICAKYEGASNVQSDIIEDDIIDLQYYLQKYAKSMTITIMRSSYFVVLSQVIRRIPHYEWVNVFSILWNNDKVFTSLFERLVNALHRLNFQNEVYVPIEAVLNDRNTIMSVDCLNGLNDAVETGDDRDSTIVVVPTEHGEDKRVEHFSKSELSAVCREVVFKVDKEYLENDAHFDMTMIPEDTQRLLSKSVSRDILRNTDLLDFPGAKPREVIASENLIKDMALVFRRGKVAFLFNKYNESAMINVLLYCHNQSDNRVTKMYITLDDWIKEYVGADHVQRAKRIKDMQVSPLFVISTMFNVSMAYDEKEDDNKELLKARWRERLDKALYNDCFKAHSVDWFENWTAPGESFKNCYLLRDYKYSDNTGKGNKLYDGYFTTNREQSSLLREFRKKDGQVIDFYNVIRDSFLEYENVTKFFENPAKSWDVAATINNDGSLYIIEQLSIVAKNVAKARDNMFRERLDSVTHNVRLLMSEFYVPEDKETIFEDNMRKANAVIRELDFTCNSDNYYFGHLIQLLQVNEAAVYSELHHLVNSSLLPDIVHSMEYELIRKRCGEGLDNCKSDDERWRCIMTTYSLPNKEQSQEYLQSKGVDAELLFTGRYKKKKNSAVIADSVFDMWKQRLLSPQFVDNMTIGNRFNGLVMSNLLSTIVSTAEELRLCERIEALIAEYVDVMDITSINEPFVADLMASEINNFVCDLGYGYREEAQKSKLRAVAAERNLAIFNYIDKEDNTELTEEVITRLFNRLSSSPDAITPAYEYNYFKWGEYVMISFIARTDVGLGNPAANRALKVLIDKLS